MTMRGTKGRTVRLRDGLRALRSFALLARAILLSRPVRPRSLAERLAALPADGVPLSRPVAIRWSDHQVPWIEAETDRDCAIALGVVHAHLRLGQMEIMRRVAYGRVAEMFGPIAGDADCKEVPAEFSLPGFWRAGESIRLPLRPETAARDYPHATRLLPRGGQ